MNGAIESYIKRYNDYWKEAENQRQRRKQQGSKHNPIIHLANQIRNLISPLLKGQSQAAFDEIAVVKS